MDFRPRNGSSPALTQQEHSASHAIERLVSATHGMIAKRIDLALLEGRQMSQRLLIAAGLATCGMLLICSGLIALAYALTLLLMPEGPAIARATLFGLLNVGLAAVLAGPAIYVARSLRPAPNGSGHNGWKAETELSEPADRGH